METFAHIKAVVSIIMGLSLTHLLKGAVKFIVHPGRTKPYWVHLAWVFYLFVLLVHFWWWEVYLNDITHWVFTGYFFLISYITLYFVACNILFPDDLKEYNGYEDYFYSRRKWFFGCMALLFAADIVDTFLKQEDHIRRLGTEITIRDLTHVALCIVAMFIRSRVFHAILIAGFIFYELLLIFRLYYT